MKKLVLMIAGTLSLMGCSNEKEELKARVAELEMQLDECENGAGKLFNQIESEYGADNFTKVVELYKELSKRHNGSSEQKKALELNNYALASLKKSEEAKEKERSKRIAEEEALKEKEEKARAASLKKLNKRLDDVSGITWYHQPYFTHYVNSNRVSIEMGKRSSGYPWLTLTMSYTGDDWIFFKNAYLSYDGNTKEILFNDYQDKDSDNDGGEVWEWIKVSIDEETIRFLKAFSNSPSAKMRLTGKYAKTRNLSANERKGIADVIQGYEALMRMEVPNYSIAEN